MAPLSRSKKNAAAADTPIKSQPSKSSPASSVSDDIATPEKPTQPRTRRRVAMSVKEVKRAAEELQRSKKGPGPSGLDRSGLDLLPAEEAPRPSRSRVPVELPEKYETLAKIFDFMASSIRLLRMKGMSPIFPNICASVENLTNRRFTHEHLLQLKYILPEAIVVRKVILGDNVTGWKPELHVTLQVEAIGDIAKGKEDSGSALRRVFRERLANFSKEHPEGDDVPEAQLPGPSNQTESSIHLNSYSPSVQPSSDTSPCQQLAAPSHMSGSFKRRFSQKLPTPDSQKTPLACYSKTLPEGDPLDYVAPSPIKYTMKLPLNRKSLLGCPAPLPSSCTLATHEEEAKKPTMSDDKCQKKLHTFDGTPAKLVTTPSRLMAATPEMQTPKRCRSTMEFNSPPMGFNSSPPNKSMRRSTRTQLFTTPTKNVIKVDQETRVKGSSVDDTLSFLPESLLQSVREKEKKALEEKDAGVVEAKRRQKLIAGLPNIFDIILLIFQSSKHSVMTKQDLIYKIVVNNSKIVDRGEVEEQLKLLQELVPDWISEKIASSGDILCRVNKISTSGEIRQRLAEAE
ncbi:CDT1-like protein a, chloroplastic [Iris pallida]|uniref:CDT1-like protein a, chloroplastic n=1 Tax=Iris pallida TaxID=29817 RepID=A0AAX6DLQ6_IRIPA|nr:CDT1-like protein a, chloroplastic [Iris pallida]